MIVDLIKKIIKNSEILVVQDSDKLVIKAGTVYLVETGTVKRGAGFSTSIRMTFFERNEEENDATYEKLKSLIGTRNEIDGIVLYHIYWSSENPQISLDNNWGRDVTLRIVHMEDE